MATQRSESQVTLRVTRALAYPRERVWRAWTEAGALARWMAPADGFTTTVPELDLRPGGRYAIEMIAPDGNLNRVVGSYREVRAPERLVFTWQWETGGMREETVVTVELRERAGGTELTLTHERFPNEKTRDDHSHGWDGCLARLAQHA